VVPLTYKSQYTPYERFIGVLNSKETKRTYTKNLKYFLHFCQLEDYSDLIEKLPSSSSSSSESEIYGNDPKLITLMQTVALSDEEDGGSNTYGVTYRIDKPYFEDYLPTVEKIIDSLEIIK
jgi:hypothetical protein